MTAGDDVLFNLSVPVVEGDPLSILMRSGNTLFLLGANGTGKSSLIHRFYVDHFAKAIRISAHRQTWLSSSTAELTARQKQQQETQIRDRERKPESRWTGAYDAQRASMAIFNLIDAENSMAREITAAVRNGDDDQAHKLAEASSPLEQINDLLRFANLPVAISIEAGDEIRAARADQPPYGMAEMSDGERNAVLVAADILTANPGSLFVIDEPERHLHRSIITPLLSALFSIRDDCSFVIATHEVGLPLDFPESKALLLRASKFEGGRAVAWDADLLEHSHSLDEQLQRDILGARRGILFVEGKTGASLDQPLYGRLFPSLSIIPKGGRGQVLHAVKGLRSAKDIAWVDAFGVVDRDYDSSEEVEVLRRAGVFALDFCSVESIYYHPELQRRVAARRAKLFGDDPESTLDSVRRTAIDRVQQSADYIVEKRAAEAARRIAQECIPTDIDVDLKLTIASVDVPALRDQERAKLDKAIEDGDLATIIERYPVHETGALAVIAEGLGFRSRPEYERAVRKLLDDDEESLEWARGLFGPLVTEIAASVGVTP